MELKCKKCVHYYVKMVGADGVGYNPGPSCYLFEDKGEWPKILTQECYEPKKGNRYEQGKKKSAERAERIA